MEKNTSPPIQSQRAILKSIGDIGAFRAHYEIKIGSKKLKMSSGEVRTFKSKKARDNFERTAQAVKHGFKPTKKRG